MSSAEIPFWDSVDQIRAADPRFRREAYGFVMAALGVTVQSLPSERRQDVERRHLSGGELVRGVVAFARHEFGVLGPAVFREWGVKNSLDIGTIVFQLVKAGQLSARPEDRLEDFAGGPELFDALSQGLELGGPRVDPESRPRREPGGPGATLPS